MYTLGLHRYAESGKLWLMGPDHIGIAADYMYIL